jgi:hypothetical protein
MYLENTGDHTMDNTAAIENALNAHYSIITGLEGSSKSLGAIKRVLETATSEGPVIVGVKNFTLMSEQRNNWLDYFDLHSGAIAICGISENDKAMEHYTNKKYPSLVPENCKIVLMSQRAIQMGHHNALSLAGNDERTLGVPLRKFTRIIIDEFDFSLSLIPSMAFMMESMARNNDIIDGKLNQAATKYILENYSRADAAAFQAFAKTNKHFIAKWISSGLPVTFLTSEKLACEFLTAVGFKEFALEHKDFTNSSIVHVNALPYINGVFYEIMRKRLGWKDMVREFDVVISDRADLITDLAVDVLDKSKSIDGKPIINHTNVRGSNALKGKSILTILTHIPKYSIQLITSALNQFSKDRTWTFDEVQGVYYRDRMMQAVGRTIGYRGEVGKVNEAWLLVHSDIMEEIDNYAKTNPLPYTFDRSWHASIRNSDEVAAEVSKVNSERWEFKKAVTFSKSLDILTDYFAEDSESIVDYADITKYIAEHSILGLNNTLLNARSVVAYFSVAKSKKTYWDKDNRKYVTKTHVKGIRFTKDNK